MRAEALEQHHVPPSPLAIDYLTAVSASHYMVPTAALLVLAAVITNIVLFHLTMDPGGIAPGIVVTVLWFVAAYPLRARFLALFTPRSDIAVTS